MYFTQLAPLLISLSSYHHLLVGAAPSALINQPQLSGHAGAINSPSFIRRGEPNTGDDFPDTDSHPNELDQVETAFADALELASFVKTYIDEDDEVFGHYFNLDDKAEVKRIFTDLYNGGKGHDKLSNIFVQKKDNRGSCSGGRTLAYMEDTNTDKPFIVLCPPAFKKKAVEALKGSDDDRNKWQAGCKEDGGDIDTHVSYTMNTLGMTLLHEYMHYDGMIDSKFGSIVDDPSGRAGYGPVNVYNKLDKKLARVNADSYAYFASEVLWTVLCQKKFQAPRPGIDDADPDCDGSTCQP